MNFIRAIPFLAISCLAWSPTMAQSTNNFEFAVQAEQGLKLSISGYSKAGKKTFEKKTSTREMRDGNGYYVVRIDENIIFNSGVGMWCVQDLRKKWKLPAEIGKQAGEVICDRSPKDNRGSYLFVGK